MNSYIVQFDRAAAPFLIDIPFLSVRQLHSLRLSVKVIDSIVLIMIIIKYIVCLPQAVCGCGWLIINASVEAYRACQVYESSLSSQQSQSVSHSALNIKC